MGNTYLERLREMNKKKEELGLYGIGGSPVAYVKPEIKVTEAFGVEDELSRMENVIDGILSAEDVGGRYCPKVKKIVIPHTPKNAGPTFRMELKMKGRICSVNQDQICFEAIEDPDECFEKTAVDVGEESE